MPLDYCYNTLPIDQFDWEAYQDSKLRGIWNQGTITLEFLDFKYWTEALQWRKTDEEGFPLNPVERKRIFNISRTLKLQSDLFRREPYLLATITPSKIVKILDVHISQFKLMDFRVIGALSQNDRLGYHLRKCVFKRRHKAVKPAPLSWLCMVQIHKSYTTEMKYNLFKRSEEVYMGKIKHGQIEPILPKSTLLTLSRFEEACFRCLRAYQRFETQTLDEKLTQIVLHPTKVPEIQLSPSIPTSSNTKVADIIFNKVRTFLILPMNPLGIVLSRRKISLERLFLEKEVKKLVKKHRREIEAEMLQNPNLIKLTPKTKYEYFVTLDVVKDLYFHFDHVTVKASLAIDINSLFRENKSLILLYVIPKFVRNNEVERVLCGINYEKFLELCQFL